MTVVPAKSQQYNESDDEADAEDPPGDAGDIEPPDIQGLLALIDNAGDFPSDIDSEAGGDGEPSDSHDDGGALSTGETPAGHGAPGQLSDSD